jgi:tetraacyldisaccharide 4'-kinase
MPFSHLYGKLSDLRNTLYDRGILRSYPLGSRTISIGNITTGGTGKTPLVAYIARILTERGEKVCILTRGYGRSNPADRIVVSDKNTLVTDPKLAGDEPVELARTLGETVVIIADGDRVAAAEWARGAYDLTTFILDDGFQHRRARRNLDILCIDATNPWGGGATLPGGRLRETIGGVRRAHIVVITRSDLVQEVERLRTEILRLNPKAAVFAARNEVVRVSELNEYKGVEGHGERESYWDLAGIANSLPTSSDDSLRTLAFCAIGNPQNFFGLIERFHGRFQLAETRIFPDHHYYTQSDVEGLETAAGGVEAAALLTTAKDAVKVKDLSFTMPCYVVEIEIVLDRPDEFAALL